MTRCADFWHKWRKEPNFCGLSPQAISEIKGYLELVDKLKKTGIEEDAIYENCPSGACRPLLRLADDETRTEGMNYIVSRLKKGKTITQKDLQETLNTYLGKEAKSCKISTQMRTDDTPTGENEDKSTQMRTNGSSTEETEPQKLPPEKCFSPQPGSVPVTDASPQPSLAEQIRPAKAPCLSGQPCPDGKDHLNDKKNKCEAWGRYLNQLPFDECWITVKERRDAQRGSGESLFHSAGANVPPKSTQPLPTVSRHPLLKSRQEQDDFTGKFVDNCLTDRYHRIIRDAMTEHDELLTPLDVICRGLDLVSEHEEMGD